MLSWMDACDWKRKTKQYYLLKLFSSREWESMSQCFLTSDPPTPLIQSLSFFFVFLLWWFSSRSKMKNPFPSYSKHTLA